MKTLEYLLALGAGGYLAFRSANYILLNKFFKQTQLRIKVLQAHRRDLASQLKIDGKATQLRVIYRDDGLSGWHLPVMTDRVL